MFFAEQKPIWNHRVTQLVLVALGKNTMFLAALFGTQIKARPKYTVRKGKTPVLAQEEARELLDAIDTSTVVGLRDRALINTVDY
jgi:hypothetical protein